MMKLKTKTLKATVFLLSLLISVSSFSDTVLINNISAKEISVRGDVNNDGMINILDMILLKSHLNENNQQIDNVSADVDNDSVITYSDAAELLLYMINCTKSFSYEKNTDTDNDGLNDYFEKEISHTEYDNPDSDGDKLSDFVEVYLCHTDPMNEFTGTSKVSDYDTDSDNDGITNGEEVTKHKTSPGNVDTDYDGISDYEEIYGNIKSDPLKKDSDGDGISDLGERKLSLNPIEEKSDGKTFDNSRYFSQNLQNEDLYEINTEDNFYYLSVSANMRGYASDDLNVSESSYSNRFEEYAVFGKVIDVEYSDKYRDDSSKFSLKLEFELKNCSNPNDYMIFKYIEDAYILLPTDTEWDGNKLLLNDTEDGTYCIVNVDELDFNVGENIVADSEFSNASMASVQLNAVSNVAKSDVKNKSVSYTCIFNLGSSFKVGFWEAGVRTAVENSVKKLYTNGYSTTVTMIFEGSYAAGRYYKVSITCNSPTEVSKVCSEASSFFSKSITSTNAEKAYNEANKNLGNKLYIEYSKLNYSSYTGSLSPVFVFNDTVSGAICKFRTGGAVCSVLQKNMMLYSFAGTDGTQRIYDIVTKGEDKISYKNSMFGSILMKTKLTAQMVNSFNSKKLTAQQRKELGFIDTDGDGIDDSLEIAMNLLKVVNGKIIYPSYSDAAGKNSVILRGIDKFADKKGVISEKVKETQYLPTKLLVNNPDSDGDGYSDAEDPDEKNGPKCLGGKYDFLDQEIYYVEFDTACQNLENSASSAVISKSNKKDSQKIKFEWFSGKGYKITALSDPSKALTISDISGDTGKVSFKDFSGGDDQLWEVLPFYKKDSVFSKDYVYGLVIRSKVLIDDGCYGKSLYLSCSQNKVSVSAERNLSCRIFFNNIANWDRFGKLYMVNENWISNNDLNVNRVNNAFETYKNNIGKGFSNINKYFDTNYSVNVLLGQSASGGKFQELKYGESYMSDVACEIIATYDALKMKNYIQNDYSFSHFFKLATEFEFGAMKSSININIDKLDSIVGVDISQIGVFGSEPKEIYKCLDAYNVSYESYNRDNYMLEAIPFGNGTGDKKFATKVAELAAGRMDNNISSNDVVIASYNFSTMYLAIHTFSGYMLYPSNMYFINRDTYSSVPELLTSVDESTNYTTSNEHIFRVGYILK